MNENGVKLDLVGFECEYTNLKQIAEIHNNKIREQTNKPNTVYNINIV